MEKLDSAVKLTKFLHSRASKEELLKVATDATLPQSKIYLPQKEIVLLDWLLDRLGSSLSKDGWRVDSMSWLLVKKLWQGLSGDSESRQLIQTKHDWYQIFASTLNDFATTEILPEEAMKDFSNAIEAINRDFIWGKPTADAGFNFLSSFFKLGIVTTNYSALEQLQQIANLSLDLQIPKKKLEFYGKEIFTSALVTSSIPELKHTSYRALSNYMKQEEDISSPLKKALGFFSEKKHIPGAIGRLFEVVIETTPESAASRFQVMAELTPQSMYQLLRVAVERRIKISQEALNNLVSQHVKASPDWKLLHLVLNLDSDVILHVSGKLYEVVDETSECLEFLCAMIQSYAHSREFPEFFIQWGKLLFSNSVWQNKKIVDEVVQQLRHISSGQLNSLLDHLVSTFSEKHESKKLKKDETPQPEIVPSIAVARSLLSSSSTVVERLHDNLQALLLADCGLEDPKMWTLKYLILSINSDFVESGKNLQSQVASMRIGKKQRGQFELWTSLLKVVFRLREFYEFEFFDTLVTQILNYMDGNPELASGCLSILTNRWLLLANAHFGEQHLTLLSQLYLNNNDALIELVQNPLFFEQTAFVNELIHQIIRQLEDEVTFDVIECLRHFPIEVFSKFLRKRVLDLLVDQYKEGADVMAKLVQWPTFESKIETDVDLLTKVTSKMPSEAVFKIVRLVIKNHIQNISEKNSAAFITKLVRKIIKLMQKPMEWSLQFCTVAIEEIGVDLMKEAANDVLKGFITILSDSTVKPHIETLKSLHSFVQHAKGNPLVRQVADQVREFDGIIDPMIEFGIICQALDSNFENAKLVTSKFVLLNDRSSYSSSWLSYRDFMSRLDVVPILDNLLLGFMEGNLFYLDAIRVCCSLLDKDSQDKFVQVLSTVSEKYRGFDLNALLSAFDLMDSVLKEQASLVSQHALEIILTFVAKSLELNGPVFNALDKTCDLYISATHVISSVLLNHRHRLNGRYYIVMHVFQALLTPLSIPSKSKPDRAGWISSSSTVGPDEDSQCAIAYSRLLSNLCEPPVQSVKKSSDLNSSSSLAKRELSKHLYSILHSYVLLSLSPGFRSQVRDQLRTGFYPVFDVMGSDRLKIANDMMDSSGRAVLRAIYEDYQKNGKWREE